MATKDPSGWNAIACTFSPNSCKQSSCCVLTSNNLNVASWLAVPIKFPVGWNLTHATRISCPWSWAIGVSCVVENSNTDPSIDAEQISSGVSLIPEFGCQSREQHLWVCPRKLVTGFEWGRVNNLINPEKDDVAKCCEEGWIDIAESGRSHAYCEAIIEYCLMDLTWLLKHSCFSDKVSLLLSFWSAKRAFALDI